MNSILNILYNNNDSTLEIPLYNTTHYIRSDIYKLNIEPLKTFIQAGWWFIVGVPLLKYIRRSILRLKGVNYLQPMISRTCLVTYYNV